MVKGFGGMVQVKGEVTIIWKIEDDDGVIHTIYIKKTLCLHEASSYLLAPQQWAQQEKYIYTTPGGTWCTTKARHCTLYWNH